MRWRRLRREQLRKPVKWIAERTEHFLGDSHGRDNVTTAQLALDDKGRFLALDIDIVADMGAYLSCYAPYIPVARRRHGDRRLRHSGLRMCGCARAYTNTVPVDAYRGAGRPEASYLIERLVDAAARDLGIGARRVAPAQFHQAEGDAVHDADRQDLRLRRFRRHLGARAGARRLGRLQRSARAQSKRAGKAARHRPCDLYRGLRQ